MKITILTPLYWPSHGGIQVSTRLIASHLAKRGHEVAVFTSQLKYLGEADVKNFKKITHFPETENQNGVFIRRFPTGGILDFLDGVLYAAAYRLRLPFWQKLHDHYWLRRLRAKSMLGYLKSNPPDVLLIAPYTDALIKLGLEAKRLTGAALAIKTTLHLSSMDFAPRQLHLLRECDAILSNTSVETDHLKKEGVPTDKIHEMDEPVDMEIMNFLKTAAEDPAVIPILGKKYVLYLGRKEKGKGIDNLVSVFEKSAKELHGVSLVLAGEPSAYFEFEIRPRLSKNSSIIVMDEVSETVKWWLLKHASVYCMVSNTDSFGITYVEAWLSGVPVIAADLPAMRCVISHEEDGLLVPYGDEKQIKTGLLRLLSDKNLAVKMGEKGRQKILTKNENFAIEKRIEKILLSLCNKKS